MSALTEETADGQGAEQSARQLPAGRAQRQIPLPSRTPLLPPRLWSSPLPHSAPPAPALVSQARLAPWELRPRKLGSQDPHNGEPGVEGGRSYRWQPPPCRDPPFPAAQPSSGGKASRTRAAGLELGLGSSPGFVHSEAVQPWAGGWPLLVSSLCKRQVVMPAAARRGSLQRAAGRAGQAEVEKTSTLSKLTALPSASHALSFPRLQLSVPAPRGRLSEDRTSGLQTHKDVLSPSNSSGGDVQKHESHMSMLEAVTAPRSHGESLEAFRARLKRDTPPPRLL